MRQDRLARDSQAQPGASGLTSDIRLPDGLDSLRGNPRTAIPDVNPDRVRPGHGGAANAYLGLRVGMTVSASIPAAVMTVALFKLFRARGTLLEANLSQTVGSASTSLASGTIFTIPALFLWGMAPPYLQVVALCFLGGVLGLSAMIPLRRLLIVEGHKELPYPEGTACAEVLRATAAGVGGGAGQAHRLGAPG